MDPQKAKIRVGVAVVLGIAILIFSYTWLTEFQIQREKHFYRVRFTEVGWIKEGDVVTVLGVPKGRVQKIELFPDSVLLHISLQDTELREGARARLESQGLIGGMRIGMTLGHGAPLPEGSVIPGVGGGGVAELVTNFGQFMRQSDSLLVSS